MDNLDAKVYYMLEGPYRFGVVVDPHFSVSPPESRKDDYLNSMIIKLDGVLKLSRDLKWHFVIFTGDIFHLKTQHQRLCTKLTMKLKSFPCPCYTILGNHDVKYDNTKIIDDTLIGNLIAGEALKRFALISNNHVKIWGFDYEEACEFKNSCAKFEENEINIGVFHAFVNQQTPNTACITVDKNCPYDAVIAGHDHIPYPIQKIGKCVLVRPGALSRGTAHDYNRARDVYVADVSVNFEGPEYVSAQLCKIDVLSADDVFLPIELERKDFQKKLKEFVHKFSSQIVDEDVKYEDMINGFSGTKLAKDKLISYLKVNGVT